MRKRKKEPEKNFHREECNGDKKTGEPDINRGGKRRRRRYIRGEGKEEWIREFILGRLKGDGYVDYEL